MAAKKPALLIEYELEFLETKLKELKDYIEATPFSGLVDRINYKETRNGGMVQTVVASKEAQRKDLTQALKDYADILRTVEAMREKEEAKIESRGKGEITGQASNWLKNK